MVRSGGYRSTRLNLSDAGIWVTKNSGSYVGRLNAEVGLVDTKLVVQAPEFDVLQSGSTVLVSEQSPTRLQPIDVRLGEFIQNAVTLPADSKATLGGQTLAITQAGKVWVGSAAEPAALLRNPPSLNLGKQSVIAAVGLNGVVHVASLDGRVQDLRPNGSKARSHDWSKSWKTPTVTSVGDVPVVLDASTGILYAPGRPAVSLGKDSGAILQQPGPASDHVLVGTNSTLMSIPLHGGAPKRLFDGSGKAVAPVQLGGCSYGAWQTKASYVQLCPGANPQSANLPTVQNSDQLRFRVNRNRIELNDVNNGDLLLSNRDPSRMDSWSQAQTAVKGAGNDPGAPDVQGKITDLNVVRPNASLLNSPPVANPDFAGTRPGRPVVVPVLSNDVDADGDILTVTKISALQGALPGQAAQIVDNGSQVQVPAPQTPGIPITFDYSISDGHVRPGRPDPSARVTVQLHLDTVNSPPVVPSLSIKVAGGTTVVVDVLAGATDPDGDPISLSAVRAQEGLAQFRPDGHILLQAPTTSVTPYNVGFTAVDDHGGVTNGNLRVTVVGSTGLKPVIHDDQIRLASGHSGTINVLANDLSPAGSPLTLTAITSNPGTVTTFSSGGLVQVTSTSIGNHDLTYTVKDSSGASATGILRVSVVGALDETPIAVRDDIAVAPAHPVRADVLQNDTDPDGRVLSVTGVSGVPPGLTVQLIGRSALQVTTNQVITNSLQFTYTVSNGKETATGLVVVHALHPSDAPPVATPDDATVRAKTSTSINVLANDFDPNGEPLHLVSVSRLGPGQGTLFVEGDEVRFLAGDRAGEISGQYTVGDSSGRTAVGKIELHVTAPSASGNHKPMPQTLIARVVAGHETTIVVPLSGVDPDGDPVTLIGLKTTPRLGQVVAIEDESITYRANGQAGTDTFSYLVRDPFNAEGIGTIEIGIVSADTPNAPPTAEPDQASVRPGESTLIAVLDNDTDPDGDLLSLVPTGISAPSLGSAQPAGDLISYKAPAHVPAAGATDTFTYEVTDGRGGQSRGLVSVNISKDAAPQAPIAVDDVLGPQKPGSTVTIPVLANDLNPSGPVADLHIVSTDLPGSTIVDGRKIQFTMPNTSVFGSYTVSNNTGTASALISVPVSTGLPPLASPDSATTGAGQPVTIRVLSNDSSRGNGSLTLGAVGTPNSGSAVASGDEVVYTPEPGFTGYASFDYTVSNSSGSATGTVSVLVTGARSILTFTPLPLDMTPGGARPVDLANAVSGAAPGETLTFSVSGAGNGVNASLTGSSLTVSVDASAPSGTTPLTVSVLGSSGGSTTGSVEVTVAAVPGPGAVPDVVPASTGTGPVSFDVTSNDINPGGGTLTVTAASNGDGQVTVTGNVVTFTPNSGFTGTSTVNYQITDSRNLSSSSTVTFQIDPPPHQNPGAPGTPVAVAEVGGVTLTWLPSPTPDVSYLVQSTDGVPEDCTISPCTINGLDAVPISFQVEAVDSTGANSGWSASSDPVTPDPQPQPPNDPDVTVTPDVSGAITVVATDTSDVAGYTVTDPSGATQQFPGQDLAQTFQFNGELPNVCNQGAVSGAFTISVTAYNSDNQPSSTISNNDMVPPSPIPVAAQPDVTPVTGGISVGELDRQGCAFANIVITGQAIGALPPAPFTPGFVPLTTPDNYTVQIQLCATPDDCGQAGTGSNVVVQAPLGPPATPIIVGSCQSDSVLWTWSSLPGSGESPAARYLYTVDGATAPASDTMMDIPYLDGTITGDHSISVIAVGADEQQSAPGTMTVTCPS